MSTPVLSCRGVMSSGAALLAETYLLICCGTIHSTLITAMQEKNEPSGIYLEWLQESKGMTRDMAGALKVQKWVSKSVSSAQQGCMAAKACGSVLVTTTDAKLGLVAGPSAQGRSAETHQCRQTCNFLRWQTTHNMPRLREPYTAALQLD